MDKRIKKFIPFYLLRTFSPVLRIAAVLLVMLLTITLIDTLGASYNPRLTIDAYTSTGDVSPNVIGYSTDSDFAYLDTLSTALANNPVSMMRIYQGFDPGARMLVKEEQGRYTILASDQTPHTFNTLYRLEAEVNGDTIKIFVDGTKIFETRDATFRTGATGLLTSYNARTFFDNVEITNLDTHDRIFSDTFDTDKSDWRIENIDRPASEGSWTTKDGKTSFIGKHPLALKVVGNNQWKNYRISAQVKSEDAGWGTRGFIGLDLRSSSADNGYHFLWRTQEQQPTYSGKPWGVRDEAGAIRLAHERNLEPIAVVNTRGTAETAAAFVRKLNREERLGVRYFEIGNEHYINDDVKMTPEAYANVVNDFARAMKAVDPNIKISAAVMLGTGDAAWESTLLQKAGGSLDALSVHYYPFGTTGNEEDNQLLASPYSFAYNVRTGYGSGQGVVERIHSLVHTYAPSREGKIQTIVTEYNSASDSKGKSLIYALSAADLIGKMIEKEVPVSLFHGIGTYGSHWGAFTPNLTARPAALTLSMIQKHMGEEKVFSTLSDVPAFSVRGRGSMPDLANIPYLSTYVTRNDERTKLFILAINKHAVSDMRTTITLQNAEVGASGIAYILNGQSLSSNNETREEVSITTRPLSTSNTMTYTFPAHSVTILEFPVKPKASAPEPPATTPVPTPAPEQPPVGGSPDNVTVASEIFVSAGKGGGPQIRSFDRFGAAGGTNFFAFAQSFRGGVSLASGDILGDNQKEIIAGAGSGGGPQIRAFTPQGKEVLNFFPFHPSFRGGLNVATGDVDGDGKQEIAVVQASAGQAWVKVYKADTAHTIVGYWNAFGDVECGGDIAMGDIDRDGKDEIIVAAGEGGGPQIRVFEADGSVKPIQFFAFHRDFRGPLSVAAGDADGDGKDEIIVAQNRPGDESWVKVYRYNTNKTIVGEFRAYDDAKIGATVAAGDVDGNGSADVITGAGEGGAPHVRTFAASGTPLANGFFAFDQSLRSGAEVAVPR